MKYMFFINNPKINNPDCKILLHRKSLFRVDVSLVSLKPSWRSRSEILDVMKLLQSINWAQITLLFRHDGFIDAKLMSTRNSDRAQTSAVPPGEVWKWKPHNAFGYIFCYNLPFQKNVELDSGRAKASKVEIWISDGAIEKIFEEGTPSRSGLQQKAYEALHWFWFRWVVFLCSTLTGWPTIWRGPWKFQ